MWMTREEIAEYLGIVPNSVRGKVQKGQIERKVEGERIYIGVVESPASQKGPRDGPAFPTRGLEYRSGMTERIASSRGPRKKARSIPRRCC